MFGYSIKPKHASIAFRAKWNAKNEEMACSVFFSSQKNQGLAGFIKDFKYFECLTKSGNSKKSCMTFLLRKTFFAQ